MESGWQSQLLSARDARTNFSDEENYKQIFKALELVAYLRAACPWGHILLLRISLLLVMDICSGEACSDPVFELGCGEHWVLLAKVLYFFLSANRTLFYGTMPPTR